MSSVTIKGLDSLRAKLTALGANVQAICNSVVRQVTEDAAETAVAYAPASKITQSKSDGTASLKSGIVSVIGNDGTMLTGYVISTAPYSHYVEFGTGQRGINSPAPPKWKGPLSYTWDWPGMAATPFLARTVDEYREQFPLAMKARLESVLAALSAK